MVQTLPELITSQACYFWTNIIIINKCFSIFSIIVLPVMKLQPSLVVTGPIGAIYGLMIKGRNTMSGFSNLLYWDNWWNKLGLSCAKLSSSWGLKLRFEVEGWSVKFAIKVWNEILSVSLSWGLKMKYEVEVWNWSLRLRFKGAVWFWSLKVRFKVEVWGCSLKLKLEVEVCSWGLKLKLEIEFWSPSLKLQFEVEV